jgi:enediyne biosynthesis protein E4
VRSILNLVRSQAARILAITVLVVLYGFARLPVLSDSERASMASRFHFMRLPLPELAGRPARYVRDVNPQVQGIAGWISSVGASVALNDLDGDGLPNDACYVNTKTNQVIVAPVPGTPERYKPFELDPSPLPFDAATTAPMGCLPGDFNEDGLMDILVYYWGRPPILFMRKDGPDKTGGPVKLSRDLYVATELVPTQDRWYTNCATQADLDGDGHVDLIFGNYFADGSRLLDAADKDPNLHMGDDLARSLNGGSKRFFLWSGATSGPAPSVQFKESEGVASDDVLHAWTLAVGAADLDGDGLPEVYFANDFGPDRLLHNLSTPGHLRFELLEGRRTLTTPKSKVLGKDSFKGMGVDFADVNGDGLLDIYVSNIADEYALEESHFVWVSTGRLDLMKKGIAPYVDMSEPMGLSRSGWGWDARFVDFDNDGVPEAIQATGFMRGTTNRWPELQELAMANPQFMHDPKYWPSFQPGDDLSGQGHDPFFVRARNGRYYDLAHEVGLDQSQISRGIAVADVNGDGQLDFALANQWMTSYVYINQSPKAGRFLGLHLVLPVGQDVSRETETRARPGYPGPDLHGRPAIGAFATVHLPDGRRLVSQVDGGSGHSGKRAPEIHFGLGDIPADTRLNVDLRWRGVDGQLHNRTLTLQPGWHTVMLGSI